MTEELQGDFFEKLGGKGFLYDWRGAERKTEKNFGKVENALIFWGVSLREQSQYGRGIRERALTGKKKKI